MRYNIPYLNYPSQPKALQKEDTKSAPRSGIPTCFFHGQCGQTMRRSILVHSLNTPVYAMEHVKVNREDSLGY